MNVHRPIAPVTVSLALLQTATLLSVGCTQAGTEVEKRIAAVENGLLPAVRIQGRDTAMALADRMAHYNVPGLSIAVINDGEIEWAAGYGVLDASSKVPVNEATVFQAASISKPVAVAAALRRVQDSTLDLDTDVNTWLSSWQLPSNEFTERQAVTLRGIMSHTAGLTVHGFPGYAMGASLPTVPQILDGAEPANTSVVRVDKLPGEGFRYSGGGITIMQLVLTDITGQPFPTIMRESVLDPLGMTRSTYQQPLPSEWRSNAATAHHGDGHPVDGRFHVYPEMAAAGLWTTPTDLARFAIEVQQAHTSGSGKVLTHEIVEQALVPQAAGPYGLGLSLESTGEMLRFGHGGSNEGFRCQLIAYADLGMGSAVMTNGSQGSALAEEILNGIAQVYGWPDYLEEEIVLAEVDPTIYQRYVGLYRFSPEAQDQVSAAWIRVSEEDARLVAVAEGQDPAELLPLSETEFLIVTPRVNVRFVSDNSGVVDRMVLRIEGGGEVEALKGSRETS